MNIMAGLPENFKGKKVVDKTGAAAPKEGATGGSYIKFLATCRKAGKSMGECSKMWKAQQEGGAKVYAKENRRRAARVVRRGGKSEEA